MTTGSRLTTLLLVLGGITGCTQEVTDPFREVTDLRKVVFEHSVELTGQYRLPEIMGAGCAVFDANGDGRLDLYFTNCGRFGGRGAPNQLLLQGGDGTFLDATTASGLGDRGFGMGVAVGDIDNDGDLDVYVGNFGKDTLYRNEGNGTFSDITKAAGITASKWASSVAFLDYDADGWLDLYVVHYVEDDQVRWCTNRQSRRDFCSPTIFEGVTDQLFRNRGDGTFEDRSAHAGIAEEASNGLGIIVDDFDDDGWPDIFIANDGEANHLWMNKGDGTFAERALSMGVAVNAHGVAEASMGVATGDVDSDGDLDLFMTHLLTESNTLYVRDGPGFIDSSTRSGLATASLSFTGFGTALIDIENDGDLDVVIGNGRVQGGTPDPRAKIDAVWNRYAEINQVFLGDGRGGFTDITDTARSFCSTAEVTRGLAVADLDRDGDVDIVIANCRGRARVFENVAQGGHWLTLRVVDPKLSRDVYGAVVRVHAGGKTFRRTVGPGNSYLSSSALALHIGLGAITTIDRIEVRWPGGGVESFAAAGVDRALTLSRGQGR